jgi:hypothetical protein
MAVNLDTRLPLAAIGNPLNPAGVMQNARSNAIQQKLDEMRMDYESRKRRRETDTERYMGEAINAIRQGRPAQTVTDFQWNAPNQTGVPQSPYEVSAREIAPAVPGRQPTLEDMQAASIDAMFKAGDIQGAFEAMKAARSGQVSQMKPFGGETKIGSDGQAYAFNQASGRYEPTGFYPQAAPEKKEKPVKVRTSRGIEFVTPKPGMVLKPPAEKPVAEKPMYSPTQLLDLNMKKQAAFKMLDSLDSAVEAYDRELRGATTTDLLNPYSERRTRLESLATQLQMAYKNAAELGAITGPDWAIINRVIETPGAMSAAKGGIDKLLRQLGEVRNLSKRDRAILDRQWSVVPGMPGQPSASSSGKTGVGGKQSFSSLPPAAQYRGKVATDQQTGRKYKSDGNQWVRVK